MKKLFGNIIFLSFSTIAFAQNLEPESHPTSELTLHNNAEPSLNGYNVAIEFMPVLIIGMFVLLITQVTKYILDNRIKNKIIDRGISEQLANSILDKSITNKKDDTIKWAFLLLGFSVGLTGVYYTTPLDIHSVAIIAFSIGISFLSYYYFLQKVNN